MIFLTILLLIFLGIWRFRINKFIETTQPDLKSVEKESEELRNYRSNLRRREKKEKDQVHYKKMFNRIRERGILSLKDKRMIYPWNEYSLKKGALIVHKSYGLRHYKLVEYKGEIKKITQQNLGRYMNIESKNDVMNAFTILYNLKKNGIYKKEIYALKEKFLSKNFKFEYDSEKLERLKEGISSPKKGWTCQFFHINGSEINHIKGMISEDKKIFSEVTRITSFKPTLLRGMAHFSLLSENDKKLVEEHNQKSSILKELVSKRNKKYDLLEMH